MEIIKQSREFLFGKNIYSFLKKGDTSYHAHWHDYYEIILYRDCSGSCIINGEEYPITKDCLFYVTPKDVHAINAKNTKDSYSICVSFSNDVVDPDIIKEVSLGPRIVTNPTQTLLVLIERIRILRISKRKESHIRFMQEHMLNAALMEIIEKGIKLDTPKRNLSPAIEKAIFYIMTDVGKKFSLEEIASLCHLSPSYFSTLFRQETGKAFIKYVNDMRIEKAKILLQENKKSVLDISLECGFNTLTHFIKIFKQITGLTPSQYRDMNAIQ